MEKVETQIDEQVEDKPTIIEKPKKMITCPDCNKTMLEKTFRYKHINVCNKPKVV